MIRIVKRFAAKKGNLKNINILAVPIEKLDPLPHFEIKDAPERLPRIRGVLARDLNIRNHPNFKKPRMQLLAALDLEHRQRADPEGIKSSLIELNSPNALQEGDEVSIETIKSRSYPRSSTITGICKKIIRSGYSSSLCIETVIMGTTARIQYKIYSPLVKSITLLKKADKEPPQI